MLLQLPCLQIMRALLVSRVALLVAFALGGSEISRARDASKRRELTPLERRKAAVALLRSSKAQSNAV